MDQIIGWVGIAFVVIPTVSIIIEQIVNHRRGVRAAELEEQYRCENNNAYAAYKAQQSV